MLALGIFRLCRIIGWDDFPPLVRARAWVVGARQTTRGSTNTRMGITNEPIVKEVEYARPVLAHFLSCAYCTGFWISLAAYGAWRAWPRATLTGAFVLALSGAVGIIATRLDP